MPTENVSLHVVKSVEAAKKPRNIPSIRADEKLALRVNEVVAVAGISRSTIYNLMKVGKLRTTLVGGRRLVLRHDLEALLQAGRD